MPSFTVPYLDAAGNSRTSSTVTLTDSTDPSLPVVLLLHGGGGTASHMTSPGTSPGFNYNFNALIPQLIDRGWHAYPNIGVWGFALDPTKSVTSWRAALAARGFGTASYSQVDNWGLLATPVRELTAIVTELLRRLPAGRRVALLGHSRGGLLARRFLVDNAANTALRSRLLTLVTMHSPHGGSELANFVNTLNGLVSNIIAASPTSAPLLHWLQGMVNAPAYQEISVGSLFLQRLVNDERNAGAPLIPTYTFGGTSSMLSRMRAWIFDGGSAIPQVTSLWPFRIEFRWRTWPLGLPSLLSDIQALGALAPELRHGAGDTLGADARARLAGARAHQTNPINHAEALWHSLIQQQVVAIIRNEAAATGLGPTVEEPA